MFLKLDDGYIKHGTTDYVLGYQRFKLLYHDHIFQIGKLGKMNLSNTDVLSEEQINTFIEMVLRMNCFMFNMVMEN